MLRVRHSSGMFRLLSYLDSQRFVQDLPKAATL